MSIISKETTVVVKEGFKTEKPFVITGFYGPGFVGMIAAKYLIESLGMKEVAYIKSRLIPPMKVIIKGKIRPAFRIYVSKERNLLVVINAGPVPHMHHWYVTKALMDWLRSQETKEIIFLEGVPVSGKLPSTRSIFTFCTDSKRLNELRRYGIRPLTDGNISGMVAGMLDECLIQKIPCIILYIPTAPVLPDVQGATRFVDALNSILGLNVDTKALLERERRIGGGLFDLVKKRIGR